MCHAEALKKHKNKNKNETQTKRTLAVEIKPLHGIKRVPQSNYIGSTV